MQLQLTSAQTARLDSISKLPKSECPACGNCSMIHNTKTHGNLLCVICEYKIEAHFPSRHSSLIRLRRYNALTIDVEYPNTVYCSHDDCTAPLLLYPEERLWTHNACCKGCGQTYSLKQLLQEKLAHDQKIRNQMN